MKLEEKKAEEWLQSIEGDDCVIITDREERRQAYIAGYKEALKMKVNITTISDAPLEMTEKDKVRNILNRLLGAVVSTRNTEETMFWITLKRDAELFLMEIDK